MIKGAYISEDEVYRYALWRIWNKSKPYAMFVMLNPSTADSKEDDPTIRRCINFAQDWGYGGIYVGNLYAYRTPDSKFLTVVSDPIGPECDRWLDLMKEVSDIRIAGWGNRKLSQGRVDQVIRILGKMHCLGVTQDRNPRHPLYLSKDVIPTEFKYLSK